MLPFIEINSFIIPTLFLSFLFYMILSGILLRKWSKKIGTFSFQKILFFMGFVIVFGLIGAKLFNAIFTYGMNFSHDPHLFNISEGRVFYGSLAGTSFAIFLITQTVRKEIRFYYWNMAAKLLGLGVGIMRFQCFLDGCCWGVISQSPLSITFTHPQATTPYLHMPLVPTQLYEAALGFFIFFYLSKQESRGLPLPALALLIYSAGRFFIEFYRGDGVSEAQFIVLSSSQILSIAIFLSTLVCLPYWKKWWQLFLQTFQRQTVR